MANEIRKDIKDIVKVENTLFCLAKNSEHECSCEQCVFNDNNFGCKLMSKSIDIDKNYARNLHALCLHNPFYHWEIYKELNIMARKEIKDKEYKLVSTTDYNIPDCSACVFGNNGKCQLVRHCTTLDAETENEMYHMCDNTQHTHWEEIKDNNTTDIKNTYKAEDCANNKVENSKKEDEHTNISSTGVESPVNDTPSNGTPSKPKVLSGNTIRDINIQITLNEAREMYFSHNPVLKTMACSAFTPAEIEDVRRCTMNVDLQTAKRLYRNAETAVRDFVLSAFSKEELED